MDACGQRTAAKLRTRHALNLSKLAYEDDPRAVTPHPIFGDVKIILDTSTNTRLLVGADKDSNVVYVAGKGTQFENLSKSGKKLALENLAKVVTKPAEKHEKEQNRAIHDLMTDFSFWLEDATEWGALVKVHNGFLSVSRAESVVGPLIEALSNAVQIASSQGKGKVRIVNCGHSLGAAIATVLVLVMKERMSELGLMDRIEIELITFGSPHVGNVPFAQAVKAAVVGVQRYAARFDMVPRLLAPITGYTHVDEASSMGESLMRQAVQLGTTLAASYQENQCSAEENENEKSEWGMLDAAGAVLDQLVDAHSLLEYENHLFHGRANFRPLLALGVQNLSVRAMSYLKGTEDDHGKMGSAAEFVSKIPSKSLFQIPLAAKAREGAALIKSSKMASQSLMRSPVIMTSIINSATQLITAGCSIATLVKVNAIKKHVQHIRTGISELQKGQNVTQRLLKQGFESSERSMDNIQRAMALSSDVILSKNQDILEWCQILGLQQERIHVQTIDAIRDLGSFVDDKFNALFQQQELLGERLLDATDRIYQQIINSEDRTHRALHEMEFRGIWENFKTTQRPLRAHLVNQLWTNVNDVRYDLCDALAYVDEKLRQYDSKFGYLHILHCELKIMLALSALKVMQIKLKDSTDISDFNSYLDIVDQYQVVIGRVILIRIMQARNLTELSPTVFLLSSSFISVLGTSQEVASELARVYASNILIDRLEGLHRAFALDPLCPRGHLIWLQSFAVGLVISTAIFDLSLTYVELKDSNRAEAIKVVLALEGSMNDETDGYLLLDVGVQLNNLELLIVASSYLLSNADDLVAATISTADAIFNVRFSSHLYQDCVAEIVGRGIACLQSKIGYNREGFYFYDNKDASVLAVVAQQLMVILHEARALRTDAIDAFVELAGAVNTVAKFVRDTKVFIPSYLSLLEAVHMSELGFISGNTLDFVRKSVVPNVLDDLDRLWPQHRIISTGDIKVTSLVFKSPIGEYCCSPTALSDNIAALTFLNELVMPSCGIMSVPISIKSCFRLLFLSLDKNNLELLPDEIGELLALTTLSVVQNKLKQLPETMINMRNLRRLDLRQNNLTSIPQFLLTMDFSFLDVKGNPLDAGTLMRLQEDNNEIVKF